MSSKPVEIGGTNFPSKKEAKSFYKKIFKAARQAIRKKQKATLEGNEMRFMIALIATDTEFNVRVTARAIIGCEIKYTTVNNGWGGRQIAAHLVFSDGSTVHFKTSDLISKLP
jgi:tRNA threonylcarbamoyladenosine modification (KEOPS) complex  Pcc1 subunit